MKLKRFIFVSNREIDYIQPKTKYSKTSITEEVKVKFRKKTT
jgi:hypothetical protein